MSWRWRSRSLLPRRRCPARSIRWAAPDGIARQKSPREPPGCTRPNSPTTRAANVVRLGAATAMLILLASATAGAQDYPQTRPQPRTTDAAALLDVARQREIRERIELGFREELKGDWKRAAAEFGRVLTLDPKEPQGSTARYDLGLAQAHLGQLDAAVASFGAAIALDPDFFAARVDLIAVNLMRNNLAAARRAAD